MWFIFGADGWIGKQFIQYIESQGIPYIKSLSRMDDEKAVEHEIVRYRPTHVITLAGRTSGGNYQTIDYLEGGKQQNLENVRDNLFGPILLAILCRKHKIHFTYLGTGCIFNYDSQHSVQNAKGFDDEDAPNFFGSSYSIVKGFTDRLFHQDVFTHVLNLRIRMPINDDLTSPRNFITKIINYRKICSVKNSMTVIPNIIPIMVDMIKQHKTGTYNMTNPGMISHNEILDMYREIVDPTFTYQNFTLEEQSKILLSERSNNYLDTTKLESEYFILPIYESVQRLFKSIRKQRIIQIEPKMDYIMVTGGFGFIGSNFIHHVLQTIPNVHIVNVDKVSYCSKRDHLVGLPVTNYEVDINDMETILTILHDHEIDVVVHFAAQSHVDNSFNNSIQFTEDNVSGTHHLLEAAKRYGKLRRFIHISTDEVYGETTRSEPFNESHLPNPTNPYAATKISAEFIVQSYFHCFDLPIIIVRGNNVYGPRQYPEKLIPKFILYLLHNKQCTVHGNGNTRRNFIYVEDICKAIVQVIKKGVVSDIYNIGTENEFSVSQIAHLLIQKIKGTHVNPHDFIKHVPDRYYNDFQYRIDSTKVKQLGWFPVTSFADGLAKTIQYYQEYESLFSFLVNTEIEEAS